MVFITCAFAQASRVTCVWPWVGFPAFPIPFIGAGLPMIAKLIEVAGNVCGSSRPARVPRFGAHPRHGASAITAKGYCLRPTAALIANRSSLTVLVTGASGL